MGCIGIGLLGLTILLIVEYRFFHDQAQKMLELKEEYRTYTLAVKKILHEYNAMKEQADEQSPADTLEKEQFILVNREPNYLKQSMIEHARKENLDFILKSIDENEWRDYSDYIGRTASSTKQKRKKRPRRRIHANNVKTFPTFYGESLSHPPKDIHFAWPIKRSDFWLSSFFGPRRKPDHSWGFHYGVDMAACKGTPVVAAADGIVIEAHFHNGYGNTILISHNQKYKTRYAHLDKIHVAVGQKVNAGQLIGKVGATGAVRARKGRDASHLHFEVYAHGKQVNPLAFFM